MEGGKIEKRDPHCVACLQTDPLLKNKRNCLYLKREKKGTLRVLRACEPTHFCVCAAENPTGTTPTQNDHVLVVTIFGSRISMSNETRPDEKICEVQMGRRCREEYV
jgi:hypothetical protein